MPTLSSLPAAPNVCLARDGYVVTLGIFVSSTCCDLQTIRTEVVGIIGQNLCVPVAMEIWLTDQQKAEEFCLKQIKNYSSHYIGIFGHRRGFIPDNLENKPNTAHKSITEAEYDWATRLSRQIAVFLPRVGSNCYRELQRLAQSNPAEDEALVEAQERFRKRVSRDTANLIDELKDMPAAVGTVVGQWRNELSLRAHTEHTASALPVHKLGRLAQVEAARAALALLAKMQGSLCAACLVVHGRRHMGHEKMVQRLRANLEEPTRSVKFASAVLSFSSSAGDLESLTGALAGELLEAPTVGLMQFASLLLDVLKHHDISLSLVDVDEYQGGFLAWIGKFWQPLVGALSPPPPGRIFVFATMQSPVEPSWNSVLFDPVVQQFSPAQPLVIPELTPFTEAEIAQWLNDYGGQSGLAAVKKAAALFAKTQGEPDDVYTRLPDYIK